MKFKTLKTITMKIELIKDTSVTGETWYFIQVDGYSKDCHKDKYEAIKLYEQIKANLQTPKKEVLMSEEVNNEC